MKHLKMLGLAAIAALSLVAFAGAGTALATRLCTDSSCTTEYAPGTELQAVSKSGTTERFTSGGSTIATCTKSSFAGTATTTSTWLIIHDTTKFSEGCSQTTHTLKAGTKKIMWSMGSNGEVVAENSEDTMVIFGVSCTYGTGSGTNLGILTGGSEPTLNISTTLLKTAGGFLCPSTVGWDAEYVYTVPHALFIGS